MSNVDNATGAPEGRPGPASGRQPGDEIVRILTWISRRAVWIGGAGIIFAAFMVTVEVFIRKVLSLSLGGADEISGYIFLVSTVWAMPFALLNRANVRVDVIYLNLPAPVRSVLDIFSLVLLVGFIGYVIWYAAPFFFESYENDTRSITPLQARIWIPQAFWVAGLALFMIVGFLLFVLSISALFKLRHDRVATLIGSRSSEEEIAAETSFLESASADGTSDRTGSEEGGG